ncbi:glycosyltransferase family 32 protein [Francisella uliginis]|uniref:Mannosyltransferase n=1 Tax=Francisella uliginis TaxID=573570 RepID=A0A1L4BRM3_9GAMM|nr:glycosyltransferase [Francisella uliginis]API86487.1 mannosyltransferase [Francisella uliginis]
MKHFQSYLPKSSFSNDGHIPKKIFMTWDSHQLSNDMYDNIQLWIEKNPEWELRLYDDKECIEFIESNFDQEVIDAYNNLLPKAYKADLFRYCALYVYGGVYTDIKIVPLQPLNNIITQDTEFLSIKDKHDKYYEFNGYIYQAFLCAKPKHPFFKQVIEMIVSNSQKGYYGNDPLCLTGPGLLGKAINICCNKPATSEIRSGIHNVSNLSFELLEYRDKSIIDRNDQEFAKSSYKGYRKELYAGRELAKSYPICWFNARCYIKNNNLPKSKYYLRKKEFFIVDYLYLIKDVKKARLFALKSCILRPLLASRIISRVIGYEKSKK